MRKSTIDKIIEANEAEIQKLLAVNRALATAQNESKRKRKATSKPRPVEDAMPAVSAR